MCSQQHGSGTYEKIISMHIDHPHFSSYLHFCRKVKDQRGSWNVDASIGCMGEGPAGVDATISEGVINVAYCTGKSNRQFGRETYGIFRNFQCQEWGNKQTGKLDVEFNEARCIRLEIVGETTVRISARVYQRRGPPGRIDVLRRFWTVDLWKKMCFSWQTQVVVCIGFFFFISIWTVVFLIDLYIMIHWSDRWIVIYSTISFTRNDHGLNQFDFWNITVMR